MSLSQDTAGTATYRETVVADDRRTFLLNRVSWGAILAGVAAALVIQLLLNMLGVGIGAATLDANSGDNPGAGTFSLTAAVWWTLSGIIASFVGGMVAGRLCGAAQTNTARWHGFVSWATTTLVIFWLLTSTLGTIVGGTFNAVGSTLSGIGRTAASAVSGVAQTADGNALEARVRQLVNPDDAQSVQDSVIAYVRATISGDEQAAEAARENAIQGVARIADISPEEARTRVDEVIQQYRQTVEQARQQAIQTAETARQGVASAAIAAFIALVLGAVAAWFGGGVGTPNRVTAGTLTERRT
ncbi:MAG: PhnA-like protein [Gammaproteobacteria bacterium]